MDAGTPAGDVDPAGQAADLEHALDYLTRILDSQVTLVGIELLKHLGEDNVMWGSDFPHPDGIWPDSQEFLTDELNHIPAETRRKIVRDNAMKLYRLGN